MTRKYTKSSPYWAAREAGMDASTAAEAAVEATVGAWGGRGNLITKDQSAKSQASVFVSGEVTSYFGPSEAYLAVPMIRQCVNIISQDVSKIKLLPMLNEKAIVSGKLVDMLAQLTPGAIADMVSNYLLFNEYVLSIKDNTLKPLKSAQLFPFTREIRDFEWYVDKWKYIMPGGLLSSPGRSYNSSGSRYHEIPADELIFMRGYSPVAQIRGASLLQALQNEASIYGNAGTFQASYFNNNCMPNYIVTLPGKTPRQHQDAIKERWIASYTGATNAHKVHFLFAGDSKNAVNVEQLGTDINKLDFTKIQSYNADMIANVFGVPPIKRGYADITRQATAEEEILGYWEVVSGIVEGLVSVLNEGLVGHKDYMWTQDITTKSIDELHGNEQDIASGVRITASMKGSALYDRVQEIKIANAVKLMDSGRLSAMEAYHIAGVEDIPDDPARQIIFVQASLTPAIPEKAEIEIGKKPEEDEDRDAALLAENDDLRAQLFDKRPLTANEKAQYDAMCKASTELRAGILKDEINLLPDYIKAMSCDEMQHDITEAVARSIYRECYGLDKDEIKAVFNGEYNKKFYRELARKGDVSITIATQGE